MHVKCFKNRICKPGNLSCLLNISGLNTDMRQNIVLFAKPLPKALVFTFLNLNTGLEKSRPANFAARVGGLLLNKNESYFCPFPTGQRWWI